ITAGTLVVGDSAGNNSGPASTLSLGAGTNVINANTVNLGFGKASGTINFAGATGSLKIRDINGLTGRATITLSQQSSGSGTSTAQLLLSGGHTMDIMASTLTIGRVTSTSSVAVG